MSVTVTAAEARMLRSVRAVLQPASVGELRMLVTPTIRTEAGPARRRSSEATYERIGPTAMRLLCDAIRIGTTHALVRHGGWHRRSFARERSTHGAPQRLWEAVPELSLRFSVASFQLCRWLCGQPVPLQPRTLGDDLLFRLVADAVVRCELDIAPLSGSPLVCLAHAALVDVDPVALAWSRLLGTDGIAVLHGLQDDHAHRWTRMELRKGELADPREHANASRRQQLVLASFLDAIDGADRRDLAGFLVDAGAQLADRPAAAWLTRLPANTSLTGRSETARAAAALLRSFDRLARWYERLATVPFFEPEYPSAQIVIAQWERLGRAGLAALSRVADELESGRGLVAAAARGEPL